MTFTKVILSLIFVCCTTFLAAADIAVVTLASGDKYKEAVRLGLENKKEYCTQHDYDFIWSEKSQDSSRPIAWSKILLVLKAMENSDYEWIFWSDADSLVMNLAIPLEDIIDDKYDFIIALGGPQINSGQFLIRNCEWSRQFLRNVYARQECINHIWWEQQAMLLELELSADVKMHTKIIPQRFLNSFAEEITWISPKSHYKPGDFIVHFAGVHELDTLSELFDKYSARVLNDSKAITLDYYLDVNGYNLSPLHSQNNEGYMTASQKKQFENTLKLYPHITSVAEIGLNGGHSADTFFQNCSNLTRFVSFDINHHGYTQPAADFFKRKYKDAFTFVIGDSLVAVPEFAARMPNEKFDLIYVDGNHNYDYCLKDIINCSALAHPETLLWVDDYNGGSIQQAVLKAQEMGVIQIESIHPSEDSCGGGRCWIEARYQQLPTNTSGVVLSEENRSLSCSR
ncbi:MAG: class I SAM-dependent methyltransferase [Parachlamydiaceae bacterium]|nr:class I SAM-dependent methyltransferase [Parachlamydiaceae bacterium]